MGYPPPIPILTRRQWKEFMKRLKNFTLTDEQIEFYREGNRKFKEDD